VPLTLKNMALSEAIVVGQSCLGSTKLALPGTSGGFLRNLGSLGMLCACTLLLGRCRCKHLTVFLGLSSSSLSGHLSITELGLERCTLGNRRAFDLAGLGGITGCGTLLSEGAGGVRFLIATHRDGLGLEDLGLCQDRVDVVAVGKREVFLAQVLGNKQRRGSCKVKCWAAVTNGGPS